MATATDENRKHSFVYKMGLRAKSTELLLTIQDAESSNPGL
jgi:hypothetical protein